MKLETKKLAGIIAVVMLTVCGILSAAFEPATDEAQKQITINVDNQTAYDILVKIQNGILGNEKVGAGQTSSLGAFYATFKDVKEIQLASGTKDGKTFEFDCPFGGDCNKIKWNQGNKSEAIVLRVATSGKEVTGKNPTNEKVSVVLTKDTAKNTLNVLIKKA